MAEPDQCGIRQPNTTQQQPGIECEPNGDDGLYAANEQPSEKRKTLLQMQILQRQILDLGRMGLRVHGTFIGEAPETPRRIRKQCRFRALH